MDAVVQSLTFPTSLLLALAFLLVVCCLHGYAKGWVVRGLVSVSTSRVLLAIGAVMLAVEGTWSLPIHRSVPFAMYMLVLLTSLGMVCLDRLRTFRRSSTRSYGFLLNHIGIFLILWAAFFGSADVRKLKMLVFEGDTENVAYTLDRKMVRVPFQVTLQKFQAEYYDDGTTPRQFTSHLVVDGNRCQTSVNDPCTLRGYTFYQDGYDIREGRYTVLQLVRDPWHYAVFLGMALLAAGSVMLLFGRWRLKVVLPVTLVLTVLFTVLTVARINFSMLMPALRSWWFVPHLFIYMVAYSLMAMAVVLELWHLVRHPSPHTHRSTAPELLMRSSSALLIIGMLTGSVWARQAWGDYWAWDPKENWAAVTWFLTLIYLHVRGKQSFKAFLIILLAFLALQITWYGVNYLPSAVHSLHAYTS